MGKKEDRENRVKEILAKLGVQIDYDKDRLYAGKEGEALVGILEQTEERFNNLTSSQVVKPVARLVTGRTEKAILKLLEDGEKTISEVISELQNKFKSLASAQAAISRAVKTLTEKGFITREGKVVKLNV